MTWPDFLILQTFVLLLPGNRPNRQAWRFFPFFLGGDRAIKSENWNWFALFELAIDSELRSPETPKSQFDIQFILLSGLHMINDNDWRSIWAIFFLLVSGRNGARFPLNDRVHFLSLVAFFPLPLSDIKGASQHTFALWPTHKNHGKDKQLSLRKSFTNQD